MSVVGDFDGPRIGLPRRAARICFSSPPLKKKKSCTTPCYDCVPLPTTINITVVLRSYVAVFQRGSHRNICSSEVKNGNVDTSWENGAVTWAISPYFDNGWEIENDSSIYSILPKQYHSSAAPTNRSVWRYASLPNCLFGISKIIGRIRERTMLLHPATWQAILNS